MWEWLLLIVSLALAWNEWTDRRAVRSLMQNRKVVQIGSIVFGGLFLYLVGKYHPRHLQQSIQYSQRWIHPDDRPMMQPMFDVAAQWSGGAAGRSTSTIRKVSESMKKQVAASQQWTCAACRAMLDATYEIDHIQRLEYGGSNELSNLQALCPNCHRHKTLREATR